MSTETTLHNFPLYFCEAMNSEKMFKSMLFGAKQWKFDEPKDNVIAIVYIYIGLSFVNYVRIHYLERRLFARYIPLGLWPLGCIW